MSLTSEIHCSGKPSINVFQWESKAWGKVSDTFTLPAFAKPSKKERRRKEPDGKKEGEKY